jgi:hypothetical protein
VERPEAKVERPGRRRAPGGRAVEAEMERLGRRRAPGGGATEAEVERPGRRGCEVVRWWRGCDVLVEEAWREAEAQHGRAEAQRETEECSMGRRRSERGRGAMWEAADGWHEGRGKWIFDWRSLYLFLLYTTQIRE